MAKSRWVALAAVGVIAPLTLAYDVSAPAILQDFESSYSSVQNKLPDIFASGYGNVYLPPPGITLNGVSVGYDVYDRFDLGSSSQPTLYGTQSQFKSVVNGIHAFGGSATIDLLWTWTNGINHSNNSSFSEFPGMVTVLQTTNPTGAGYNTLGYNTTTGDFYPTNDGNQDEEALAGLQHNNPASNYNLIRQPTTPGDPRNIPEGTGIWLGSTVANIPTASNAQYYPDKSLVRYENDPALGLTNTPIYSFNTANPMAGTPVAENATGYLMRYTQWLVQVMGVDGFRYDGGNNTYPWVMNYLDLATYDSSNRTLLDGSKENVFTFSEVYTSNIPTIQQYISKTALTNAAGTVGGDRDALDFPLYFAMTSNLSGNGAFGSGQNNWHNIVQSSLDYGDDGLLNGSSGVKFVSDQDVPAPVLSNVAYAYTLMLPGNATVYYNGQNFNNENSNNSGGEFPEGGSSDGFDGAQTALGGPFASQTGNYNLNPLGGGATTPNGNIAALVDLRNRFGRGNYREDWIEQNILAFERVGSAIVLLSNATSSTTGTGDYDSRTFNTKFAPGTILEEYTGNAASSFADPQGNIPEFVTVYANSNSSTGASVDVRVPRNVQYNSGTGSTYATGDGYLVYGLPTPTGTLNLTNVASTLGGQTFSTSASNAGYLNGTELFSTVSVIKSASFQLQLSTNAAYLNVNPGQPLVYDHDADGDIAKLIIDGGAMTVNPDGTVSTTPGANGQTITPGDVSYGYQPFAISTPGYTSADGNGSYSQTINTSALGQGYHYIEVIAFRHNNDATAPPVYSDWYETVYVDTAPANSTVLSFDPTVAGNNLNRTLDLESVDGLANNLHAILDLSLGETDAQVLGQVNGTNQPTAGDANQWQESFTTVKSGNHTVTLVSYKPDGSYSIQRFSSAQMPFLSINTGFGAGAGDLNADGKYTASDVTTFQSVLQSNNSSFNAGGDINGDGYIDLSDAFLFGPLLANHNADSGTMFLYNNMLASGYVANGTYTVNGSNTIFQDTAGATNLSAGALLVASYIKGKTLSLAAGSSVKISPNGTSSATSKLTTSLSIAGNPGNWQGQIDLTNNDLIIDYAGGADPVGMIANMLAEGYANGAWNGMGIITSSAASSDSLTALGYADTATFSLGSLGGQMLDGTSVVIKYTYVGDANLDGKVDGSDLALMKFGGDVWTQGDFNYDGIVNNDDFALFLLGNLQQQAALTQAPEPIGWGLCIPFLLAACGGRAARRTSRSTGNEKKI